MDKGTRPKNKVSHGVLDSTSFFFLLVLMVSTWPIYLQKVSQKVGMMSPLLHSFLCQNEFSWVLWHQNFGLYRPYIVDRVLKRRIKWKKNPAQISAYWCGNSEYLGYGHLFKNGFWNMEMAEGWERNRRKFCWLSYACLLSSRFQNPIAYVGIESLKRIMPTLVLGIF